MKQEIAVQFRLLIGGIAAATLLTVGIGPNAQAQKMSGKMQTTHFHAKITSQQAQLVALNKYPGTVEGKVALENEEGSWQYAVNVRSGKTLREVMVNATTGKIPNVEVTTKGEEAKEQKAEMKAAGNHKSH